MLIIPLLLLVGLVGLFLGAFLHSKFSGKAKRHNTFLLPERIRR